ncbi:MAG TPA: riboflavin synthase [Baekduia sp.]|nr:riboflavin synthase [Baekduia sp.]
MFTGLIEDIGTITKLDADADGATLTIATVMAPEISEGDSVAISGVCLTATTTAEDSFTAEAINETLVRSSLGGLQAGSPVNIELAMKVDARFGGHIVQGHVDGTGTIAGIRADGMSKVITVSAAPEVLRYVVEKGSITINGISLTVSAVDDAGFEVSLIPETLERTTLGTAEVGDIVNLENDIFAKYAEKLAAS